MKLLFCILSLLSSTPIVSGTFTTLKEFTDYALTIPEYPESDSSDWTNPDYTIFHEQRQQSLKKRLINWLRFKPVQTFPVDQLGPLLESVIQDLHKMSPPGRLVKRVLVAPDEEFYIWGELNGAFHSLVRSLNELVNLGVIDSNLKIIKPDCHFVFIGDVLNRSPYLIETAFLILRLMQINPRVAGRGHDRIFYLKGAVEDKQEWFSAGLLRELKIRFVEGTSSKIDIVSAFSNFFNSVSLAIYMIPEEQKGKAREAVRLSYFGPGYTELDEESFLYIFEDYARPVISIAKKVFQESDISVKIRAYIYAGSNLKQRIHQRGLSLIRKRDIASEWAIFSSPTASSRRLYGFFDDAFVLLSTNNGKQIADWTLTLFQQDVRFMKGFVKERPVYLLSGDMIPDDRQQKVVALQKDLVQLWNTNQQLKENCMLPQPASDTKEVIGKDKKNDQLISKLQSGKLIIGSTMDLSKQFKNYNDALRAGLSLKIDEVNKEGGVAEKKIQMIYLDDSYDPELAKANVEKFIHELKTNVTLSSMGSPTLAGYLSLVKKKEVLVVFPNTGAFRLPDLKYLLHLRTSYLEGGHMLAQYFIKNFKQRKIAFFYQDDAWGRDLFKGAKYECKKAGITQIIGVSYASNSISFVKQVEEIRNFAPEVIAFFCAPIVCKEFIKEIGVDFLRQRLLLGDTMLGLHGFNDYLERKGLSMVRLQVVPNPLMSQLEIVEEFRNHASKEKIPIDTIALEGYINASVFIDILNKIEDNMSIDNFIKAVEEIKNYDFKGLKLNFDPATRQLLHTAWINTGSDDWLPQDVDLHHPEYASDDEGIANASSKIERKHDEAEDSQINAAQLALVKAQEALKPEDDKLLSLQGEVLKIGSTMDLSKGVKSLSDGYRTGMGLKLEEINMSGGINGINFQLHVMDDLYEPARARANVQEMIKELGIDLLLAPLGTPTTDAYLDLIKEGKILALFPVARSAEYRHPDLINIIQYQMSLKQEAYTIANYVFEKYKPKRLVIFYQNDNFGIEPKNEIEYVIKNKFPEIDVLVVPQERNNVNFKEQIERIKDFKPSAIALQVTTSTAEEFVRQMGINDLHNTVLFGGSWLMVDKFLKSMKERNLDVNLVSSIPDPIFSEIELAQEFRKAANAKNEVLSVIALEGYLYMSLLAHAMKQIDAPYSKEKIINVFQAMKHYNFKGLTLNFDPKTRTILQDIWIYSTKDNSWTERSIVDAKDDVDVEVELQQNMPGKVKEGVVASREDLKAADEVMTPAVPQLTKQEAIEMAEKEHARLKPENDQLISFQNNVLQIGASMDLSKSVKPLGEAARTGIKLKIDELREAGGINGVQINFTVFDDAYITSRAYDNVLKLLQEEKIDLILMLLGGEIVTALLDLVREGKILVLFPVAKSSNLRTPTLINLITFQPDGADEFDFMTNHMVSTYGIKRLALFYENDLFGRDSAEGVNRVMKNIHPNVAYLSVSHKHSNVDFSEQVNKIKDFKPDGIAFLAVSTVIESFIREAGVDFLYGKHLYGGSWTLLDHFLKFLKLKGLDMEFASFLPDPATSNAAIASEFRDLAQKRDMTINAIEFESYFLMSVLADMLQNLEKPWTKEKIIRSFEQLKDYDFKGITLNFNPEIRTFFKDVWIYSTKKDSWTQQVFKRFTSKASINKLEEPELSTKVVEPVTTDNGEALAAAEAKGAQN